MNVETPEPGNPASQPRVDVELVRTATCNVEISDRAKGAV